ncbi:hypothetical protein ZIOFF_069966 [Zingiber officinale]|uniref:Leucine-rich repeat-containing N-terminal plant-type domain-containing protein n=1 Tax=Zingiber officinale TaxID=94328 RepID=A0A8J5CDY7_ZINOF|nr:hypothetical protein ZIOFF_069966 [Zingiber officinale]
MGQFPLKFQWLLCVMTTLVCMSMSNTITPDGEVLLSIKTAIVGSDVVFLNWRQEDPDPCSWKGVTCDSNTKRVTHVFTSGASSDGLRGVCYLTITFCYLFQKACLPQVDWFNITRNWEAKSFKAPSTVVALTDYTPQGLSLGISDASGINGWTAVDAMGKELFENQTQDTIDVVAKHEHDHDDQLEKLDECEGNKFQFKGVYEPSDSIVLEHDLFHDKNQIEGKEGLETDSTEKKLQTFNAIKDISNKLEAQKDECLSQLNENEMLINKLKLLADHHVECGGLPCLEALKVGEQAEAAVDELDFGINVSKVTVFIAGEAIDAAGRLVLWSHGDKLGEGLVQGSDGFGGEEGSLDGEGGGA